MAELHIKLKPEPEDDGEHVYDESGIGPSQPKSQPLPSSEGRKNVPTSQNPSQPVPRTANPVYDDGGIDQSEPVPQTMAGITGDNKDNEASQQNQPNLTRKSNDPSTASKKQIENAENQAGAPDKGKVDEQEGGIADKLGKGFTGSAGVAAVDKALPLQVRLLKNALRAIGGKKGFTKRKGATAGVVSLVASLLLFLFTIGVGPLKVIHLAEILQIGNANNERTSSIGMRGLIRYAKTGNVGETRLTILGSKLVERTTAKMQKIGYDFGDTNKLTNGIRGATFNTNLNDQYKNLPVSERRAAFLKNNSFLDPNNVSIKDGVISMKFDPSTTAGAKHVDLMLKSALSELQNGKIVSALSKRQFRKFYNLANIFSPIAKHWKAKTEGLADKTLNKKEAREAARLEAEERSRAVDQSRVGKRASDAKSKIKSELSRHRTGAAIGLTFTGALCVMKRIGDAGPTADRADVAKAIVEEKVQESKGSKTKVGHELLANDVSDWGNALENDKGEDVFKSKDLQGLAGKENPSGEGLPAEERQMFAVAGQDDTKKLFDAATGLACSDIGIAVQGVAGIALVFTGVGGAGAWTASRITQVVGGAVVSSVALEAAINNLEDRAKDKNILEAPFNGPLGGDRLAWASVAGAGTDGRSNGFVELSQSESNEINNASLQQRQEEFKSKSFAARIFDVYDYRSLASSFIQGTSTNPSTNLSNIASSLMNIGSTLSRLISSIFSPVQAATAYKFDGLPTYGIPKALFEDPNLQDPYANAEKIAPKLDKYKDRAEKCFAAKIEKDDEGKWDVTNDDETDPRSDEYRKAKCNDLSDYNWKRVMLFVFYSKLITAVTCFDGEPEDAATTKACDSLYGSGYSAQASPSSTGAPASIAEGSARELAQKMLGYKAEGKYNCNDNKVDCEDLELMAAGKSIKGGIACSVDTLDKRTLQIMIYIIEKGYKIGTFALCRSHPAGNSRHLVGKGLDISNINGKSLINDRSSKSLALEVNKIIFELENELSPEQIITAGVGSTNRVDAEFVKYNRVAPGNEGASAVAAFGSGTMLGHDDHIHIGY